METKLLIEKEIVALIKSKPFYAHFIQNFRRIETDKIPTLGVNITDKINLYVNPEFFNALKPVERVAVLEHEVLHIISKHCLRGNGKNHEVFNMACDVAINQYIEEYTYNGKLISKLPEGCLLPKTYNLKEGLTAEEYYKLIFKEIEKNGKGEGQGTLDDHAIWKEGAGSDEFQHEVVKNAIKKTLESTKDYGSLPSTIVEQIKKALTHETVNWRSILNKFIYRATLINSVPTKKRPNRRYGFTYEGSKVECKLDMLVAIDTSGSVSDSDLALFFSEIEKIKALGMDILVVECDTKIHKTYRYKKAPSVVTGRGGTMFEPVFDYARDCKPKPNCIVYLTDLEANLNFPNVSKIPTLWAVTQDGANEKNVPFGIGIKLKDDTNKGF